MLSIFHPKNLLSMVVSAITLLLLLMALNSLSNTEFFKKTAGSTVIKVTDGIKKAGKRAGLVKDPEPKSPFEHIKDVPLLIELTVQYVYRNLVPIVAISFFTYLFYDAIKIKLGYG